MPNRAHSYLRIRNLDTNTENQKRLDGTYTNLLRRVQNIHWNQQHPTKERIYAKLPPISDTLRCRHLLFAGHCLRAEDEIILSLILWKKNIPIRSRRMTFPECYREALHHLRGMLCWTKTCGKLLCKTSRPVPKDHDLTSAARDSSVQTVYMAKSPPGKTGGSEK